MRVLVTSAPAIGHLLPVLPVAAAARARGHDVLVGSGGSLRPIVERAGQTYAEVGPPDLDAIRARLPGFAATAGRERARRMYAEGFASVAAAWMARDLAALAARWRPDVIVHDDMEMASWIVAERLAIPHVSVQAAAWRPWQRPSLPDPQNAVRRDQGLAPDRELTGLDGALWFTTRPQSMRDPAVPLPARNRELRPQPDERIVTPSSERATWLDQRAERPRVAITLGTVNAGRTDILRPVLEDIATLDVDVVVALGGDPATVGPVPANVRVEPYVPMSDLARWADIVAHHGGAGTTLASLAAGRPMVAIPITADQFDNAADARRTGAALEVDAMRLGPGVLAGPVRRLLEEPAFAAAARSVAAEIAAMPDPAQAWREIERLRGGRETTNAGPSNG